MCPRALVCAVAIAVSASCFACSGAGLEGTTYRGEGFAFRIARPPESWARIHVSHASLAYRDEKNLAVAAVNGRCEADHDDVPLVALTQQLFIGLTDREVVSQEDVPFDGREALHTVVVAKLDGVPQKFDVWVLKKDGCVYDLYYVAPPDKYAAGAPDFERFVHGFATIPTHAD